MMQLKPQFEKKEIRPSIDSLADQVSKVLEISKGKNRFLEACEEVFNRYPRFISSDFNERLTLKRKISQLLNKRRSPVKQPEAPIEPKAPVKYNFRQEIEDRSIEKAVAKVPLFEEEIREERRTFD